MTYRDTDMEGQLPDEPHPPAQLTVGFDGSDGGRDALALALTLSSLADGTVRVIAVFPYGPFSVGYVTLQDDAAQDASPLFDEAREVLGDRISETHVFGGGSPAWVLTQLAEAGDTDAIVVGSPHRGTVGRVVLGSVARNLLHGSPCPVAVAPQGYRERVAGAGLKTIAVAYDGRPESKIALAHAKAVARAAGATLRLLTVFGPRQPVPGPPGYVPGGPPEPDAVLAAGVESIGPEIPAKGWRLDGPPAQTLAAACEDGVDLLIVGSRGYGPAMRVLLGSVSDELIRSAPCPVLVTPRG